MNPAPTLVNDWITAPFMWTVVGIFVAGCIGVWVGRIVNEDRLRAMDLKQMDENLAVGFLARAGTKVSLPWDSDELSTKLGIDPPTDARHTAMGDAIWAMAIYDRVTAS